MELEKYLYLTKTEWVKTWIEGGQIPILPASTYLSDERAGTQTPDENLIHQSPVDLLNMGLIGADDPTKVTIRRMTTSNIVINGVRLPDVTNGRYEREDGLILSFSNKKSKLIATRLGKVACVKILDIAALKKVIDEQLGIASEMHDCSYTDEHQRSHFLKSSEDAWQHEYRMFWPVTEPVTVMIPAGMAVAVKMKNLTKR